MHGAIRDRLEDLLRAERPVTQHGETADHLSSCSECLSEIKQMKGQAELLRSLRAPGDIDPAPGFYARVLQRIEERKKDSIWAFFIYSPFGNRLAYASLTIAIVLGGYVIAQESRDGHLTGVRMVAQSVHTDVPVTGNQTEQRDAVLENFVTH